MNALNITNPAAIVSAAPASVRTSVFSHAGGVKRRGSITRGSARRRARSFHDVVGTLLHFVVNPPEVFAQHADADELHAAHEKHEGDNRGKTGECDFDAEQPAHEEKQTDGEPDARRENPSIRDESQ